MIRCRWTGEALVPLSGYSMEAARTAMHPGDVVFVEPEHPRSDKSHKHQFAEIAEAWRTLPEDMLELPWAANEETLRKHALIATGYCHTYAIDCGKEATARRVKAALVSAEAGKHGYALGQVRGPVVVVWTPESQSMRAMGGKRFQESKDAVLNWIAAKIGVSVADLKGAA